MKKQQSFPNVKSHESRVLEIFDKIKDGRWNQKVSDEELQVALNNVKIVAGDRYSDGNKILPFEFCPKCGCRYTKHSGQHASYPESYCWGNCSKCGHEVWKVDNCPPIHALECKDDNYHIDI